jgi:D-alanine transaminase
MSRIAYVNGRYLPHRAAAVHIEDRGYQFADGVYEVIAVRRGRLVDFERHLDRLGRSLTETRIAWPVARRALARIVDEVMRRNRVTDGIVYIQATRGTARREHAFPPHARPSLVVMSRPAPVPNPQLLEEGVGVIVIPDERWARCDIKSVSLLPNVLGKQRAREAGAFEAWQVDREGFVTEGTSSNAWIVTRDGRLRTRHLDEAILAGITRDVLLGAAAAEGVVIEEKPFTPAEALAAAEAFITSTTSFVMPVVRIDGRNVGNGVPGPLTRRLQALYADMVARDEYHGGAR